MTLSPELISGIGQIVAVCAFFLGCLLLSGVLTWVERKQSAVMQDRIGANRAKIFGLRMFGLFHIIADAVKMLAKENFIPKNADKLLYQLAPIVSLFFALIAFSAIPFGDTLVLGDIRIPLQGLNLNIGLLYIFAMLSLGVYGVILGGFSSQSNYSFLGGLRAISQLISYEITIGASIVGLVMVYGTLNINELVYVQGEYLWGWVPKWGIVVQPAAFFIFLTAAIAENKRIPFDLPEGESEIVGYFLEYSGMRFGLFFLTDFLELILIACLLATLFFGGWQVPGLFADGFHWFNGAVLHLPALLITLIRVLAMITKILFFCWFLMVIRWTLPRFRYDQLMHLGWTILFPLSIANILITGIVLLFIK
ncbi:MAG: NADH-quinone oxidoreductase subunit H [Candidatus Omnitrophica bacterium]|nr:NADH-quinone oxidoreductase subunit H [Candidatus Omnitrophota bacterium]